MPFTLIEPFADVSAALLPPPAPFLFEIAHRQHVLRPISSERRQSRRQYIVAEVLARPLDVDGAPAGAAFRGVLADLSNKGMRILHQQTIETGLLAVQFRVWDGFFATTLRVTRIQHMAEHVVYAGSFIAPVAIPLGRDSA